MQQMTSSHVLTVSLLSDDSDEETNEKESTEKANEPVTVTEAQKLTEKVKELSLIHI